MMTQANESSGQHSGHEHFREEDWLDFARKVGDREHRARVARHLETGCPECEETLRLWAAVLAVADQEAEAGLPDSVLQRMKDRFPVRRPPKLREKIAAGAALVFDSFRQPLLAGMRASGGAVARQLLYKSGRYTIKLQVEPGMGQEGLSIVGQILDEQDPTGGLRDIAVLAMKGSKTLDRTVTNRLGEFHLEPGATDKLQLTVDVPEIGTFSVESPRRTPKVGRGAEGKATEGSGRGTKARPR
ncbi:MAG TPA: hypothetical protein VIK51_21460 [Vicinamibacteria bacterium]